MRRIDVFFIVRHMPPGCGYHREAEGFQRVSPRGVVGDAFGAGVAQSAVIFDGHTLIAPKEIASERGAIGGPAVA